MMQAAVAFSFLQTTRLKNFFFETEVFNLLHHLQSKSPVDCFHFDEDEMFCLKMSRRDYLFYIKLKNLMLQLGRHKLLHVYFCKSFIDLDKTAQSSDVVSCFLYFVQRLYSIKNDLNQFQSF